MKIFTFDLLWAVFYYITLHLISICFFFLLQNCSGEDLKVICKDGTKDRFLFFITGATGENVKTFQSVMCPGWFISTSYEQEEKPLEMCKVDSACRITSFSINWSHFLR